MKISVGVPKEVIIVEDYASDSDVLRLSSMKVVKDFIYLDLIDVGNCFVTILSPVVLILRSFDFN